MDTNLEGEFMSNDEQIEMERELKMNLRDVNLDAEKQFARESGFNRLGRAEVQIKRPLKEDEKIEAGELIAHNNMKIRDLIDQKKVFVKEIKAETAGLQDQIMHFSQELNDGYRYETKLLPYFYDAKNNERCYVDLSTGEIMRRDKAHPEDRQLRMI